MILQKYARAWLARRRFQNIRRFVLNIQLTYRVQRLQKKLEDQVGMHVCVCTCVYVYMSICVNVHVCACLITLCLILFETRAISQTQSLPMWLVVLTSQFSLGIPFLPSKTRVTSRPP